MEILHTKCEEVNGLMSVIAECNIRGHVKIVIVSVDSDGSCIVRGCSYQDADKLGLIKLARAVCPPEWLDPDELELLDARPGSLVPGHEEALVVAMTAISKGCQSAAVAIKDKAFELVKIKWAFTPGFLTSDFNRFGRPKRGGLTSIWNDPHTEPPDDYCNYKRMVDFDAYECLSKVATAVSAKTALSLSEAACLAKMSRLSERHQHDLAEVLERFNLTTEDIAQADDDGVFALIEWGDQLLAEMSAWQEGLSEAEITAVIEARRRA